MRQKRAKTYRKLMHLYTLSFGFREPYQVLVDSTMCKTAIELKYDLLKQLNTALQGEVKPMITQCCIHELYLEGRSAQPAVDLAKTFERRKCNHREAVPGDECILNVIGESNKHRYVVASQMHPLRVKLRDVPAVPLLHINRAVLVLEPPSETTIKTKQAAEEAALHAPTTDTALLKDSVQDAPRKQKKGPKGPNPLSVKKKKPRPKETLSGSTAGKRKRDVSDDGQHPTANAQHQTSQRRKRRRKSQQENGLQTGT